MISVGAEMQPNVPLETVQWSEQDHISPEH